MSEIFIIYRPYKNLSTIESLLMSWIVSLNEAGRTICFSNEYASKVLEVSVPTITRAIANLKSLGHINTFQPSGEKRIIHLKNKPEIKHISLESCDLEGVINLITPPNQNDYTPNHTDETPSSQGLDPLINLITNNKEYNKEDNKVVQQKHTTTITLEEELFTEMFVAFETPEDDYDKLFQYWIELPDDEIANSFTYYQNYIDYELKRKKKPTLYYYFKDKKYNWATIRNWQNGKK